MEPSWERWLTERRAELEDADLLRRLRPLVPVDGLRAEVGGRRVVLFSTNDYLGLSFHPRVSDAVARAARTGGMGPRGAALICGYTHEHEALERELAALMGTETALLFPTGYAANLAVLTALAGPGTAVFSDERNHASIIDGCRMAGRRGAEVHVYRHADASHLEELLVVSPAPRKLVVTDTVFSMDGDVAPIADLVALRRRHGFLLVLDEAHALLVLGERGAGAAEAAGVEDEVDVRVGTLGKAIGAHGGFLAAGAAVREHVLNTGRSFIYSTSSPVPVVAGARAALEVFRAEPAIRERLGAHLRSLGAALGVEPESAIFKVVLGEEARALHAARDLLDRGLYVPAIRPPTVAPGSCRLRVTLSAAHTEDEVDRLIAALARIPHS